MAKKPPAPTPLASNPQASPAAAVKAEKTVTASKSRAKPVTKAVTQPALKPIDKPLTEAVVKSAAEKIVKAKKPKQIRDSFTMPKTEYAVLAELKERAASLTHTVKKSELLRAGIKALAAMTDANLLSALKAVPTIKTGRPKK